MSHELEELADGSTAFFSAREVPWHKLGVVTADALNAEEALHTAKLANWNVRKVPTQVVAPGKEGGTYFLTVPDKFTVIRDNPVTGLPDALGVVGKIHRLIQNEELCHILDTIVDESGAHFETAGSLYGGRRVFVSMKMPEAVLIGGEDAVDLYLLASNSHDGSSSLRLDVTPVRTVCRNTQRAAWGQAKKTWKIRHTKTATQRIEEARKGLEVTWKYTGEFEQVANGLAEASFSDAEFDAFLQSLLPEQESERARNERTKVLDGIKSVYFDSPTEDAIRGTRWGALNAVSEYVDWSSPVRGKDSDARAVRCLTQAISEDGNELETRALALLQS